MNKVIFIIFLSIFFISFGKSNKKKNNIVCFSGVFFHQDPSSTDFIIMPKYKKTKSILENLKLDSLPKIILVSDFYPKYNAELYGKGEKIYYTTNRPAKSGYKPIAYLSYGKITVQVKDSIKYVNFKLPTNTYYLANDSVVIKIDKVLDFEKSISAKVKRPRKLKRWYDSKTGKDIEKE